jgi:MoxR-like ATPase
MRNIKRNADGQMFEFDTLNIAIKKLGLVEAGKRRYAYEAAKKILEDNGYSLIGSDYKSASPEEKVGAEVAKVTDSSEVIERFAKMISQMAGAGVSEEKLNALIDKKLESFDEGMRADVVEALNAFKSDVYDEIRKIEKPREVVVLNMKTGDRVEVGTQHEMFETLLTLISVRLNALLVGPAGSGKTTAAEKVAESLGLKYYSISVGMQTSKTEFFGYMDATGKYVRTLFREAFEKGGVFLLDELDAGNANVIVSINQALANGQCAFPDGMVNKHEDFVIVASANTFGHGASREYVGRCQLDAATLDRFMPIDWNYDEKLETSLCADKQWLRIVRAIRKNAADYKIRAIVSPRASIGGAKLLAAGLPLTAVLNMAIMKGIGQTERETLLKGVDLTYSK